MRYYAAKITKKSGKMPRVRRTDGEDAYVKIKKLKKCGIIFKKLLQFVLTLDIIIKLQSKKGGPLHARMNALNFKRRKTAMDKISAFVSEQLKTEVPAFEIGDSVVVHNKIKEGNRERIQLFEGTVIAKRNGGISETFTVRRIAYGVGVEKTFPLHSPSVVKVDVVRHGKVRRAKLYYIRERVGKAAKVKEQI